MKFVPVLDAGISYRPNQGYQAYEKGVKDDVFMKLNGNIFVGRACSNEVVYPDFFSPNAEDWWGDQLQNLHSMIQFDGLS